MNDDVQRTLHLVAIIAAVGTLVGSVELLSHLRRFLQAGLLGRAERSLEPSRVDVLTYVPLIYASLVSRLGASVVLLWWGGQVSALPCLLIFVSSVHLFLVNPYGQTAAEQFTIILFGGLSVAYASQSEFGRVTALWFIAAQCAICYAANGVHKLRSSVWRGGLAMQTIMATVMFGDSRCANLLARLPKAASFLCWCVIGWEVLFPLALLTPTAGLVFVSIGVAFHLATAVTMRLNNFLWAFPAAYPAVMFCGRQLHA
jgi:hypothetical protein